MKKDEESQSQNIVTEILGAKNNDLDQVITELKNHRGSEVPNINDAESALDISKHKIMSEIERPNKKVMKINDDGTETIARIEKVARVSLAIQKLIIKRASSFCFGNPPEYECTPNDDNEKTVYDAVRKILYHAKTNPLNKRIARDLFGYKDVAEYWYAIKQNKPSNKYGVETTLKLKCMMMSPKLGDTLYPYFDASGDMVAFSRSFSRVNESNVEQEYFETWTDSTHYLWLKSDGKYQNIEGYPEVIELGKIPIIYAHQDYFETEDVNGLIDRLEKLLSNFGDTNDYHAAPKIFTTGEIESFGEKGDSGMVIQGAEGSDMKYVSWQNAPDNVKLEIQTLLNMIYTMTQTPDISFDSVKGIGNLSGVTLKMLFMDAHLKVNDKSEILDEYLQRRVNVILAFIKKMDAKLAEACDSIEIEPHIIPYMVNDDKATLDYWLAACGNKAVISQREAVMMSGISKDTDQTMKDITEEEKSKNSFMIGEPIEA